MDKLRTQQDWDKHEKIKKQYLEDSYLPCVDMGIKEVNLKEVFRIFNADESEYIFFKDQIDNHGLEDFHISISSEANLQDIKEILTEMVEKWYDKGEPLVNL